DQAGTHHRKTDRFAHPILRLHSKQPRHAAQVEQIALSAEARDDAVGTLGDEGTVTEFLAACAHWKCVPRSLSPRRVFKVSRKSTTSLPCFSENTITHPRNRQSSIVPDPQILWSTEGTWGAPLPMNLDRRRLHCRGRFPVLIAA